MAFQTHTAPAGAQGSATSTRAAVTVTAAAQQGAALVPGVGSEAVTYMVNGEEITVSFADIKEFICPEATDAECKLFLEHCRYNRLNPYIKEAHLIKYDKNSPASIVTGKAAFEKRAEEHPQYDGYEAGIVVLCGGQIEHREGSAFWPNLGEELLGGWAKVYRKDRTRPNFEEVKLDEYIQRKRDGSVNSNWSTRPGTMIRKVALVHALREAFPTALSTMYAEEEISAAADVEGEFSELPPVDRIAPGRDPGKWTRKKPAEIAEARPSEADDPFAVPADDAAPGGPGALGGDAQ